MREPLLTNYHRFLHMVDDDAAAESQELLSGTEKTDYDELPGSRDAGDGSLNQRRASYNLYLQESSSVRNATPHNHFRLISLPRLSSAAK